MRGFARRARVADVLAWLQAHVRPLESERIAAVEGAGRVLAAEVVSGVEVPGFCRAMMDGYAVLGADTQGASAYEPIPLQVVGQAWPGRVSTATVTAGTAVRIMTGAPLPAGADAVLPAEYVQSETDRVLALHDVAPGKHVGSVGEDITSGTVVLEAGRRIRPQDVGVLASIGAGQIEVLRQPRVRIVVTGNELLPAGAVPQGVQIVDSNSPMLAALARRDGALIESCGIVPDDPSAIRRAMLDDADVVLVSGGSSVGEEDHAPRLLAEEGELLFHGIAMRPSSPAGIGRLDSRWVFLLPGNPVSCLCAYDFFAGRVIRALGGRRWEWPYPLKRAPLARKLASTVGRVDYARVRWVDQRVEPLAIGGASLLSSTTRADGFVIVPEDSEGYVEGAEVDVFSYDLDRVE